MKTASAKNKGRKLQQWIRDKILSTFKALEEKDVRSTSMGAGGEDILLSPAAEKLFPFSVECKNRERLNIWEAYSQAKENAGDKFPLLAIKRNKWQPLVVLDAEVFFMILAGQGVMKPSWKEGGHP